MSIQRARLLRYRLPLRYPVTFGDGTTLDVRKGLLLELTDDTDHTAYGDIAPLPGWSAESVQEAEATCMALLERAQGGGALESLPETQGDATAWHALPPSVRCGLSMALQAHWANEEGTDLYQLLCTFPRRSVALAPLITEVGEALEERCAALRTQQPAAVKLKVGRREPEADIARVRRVRELLGPECALRLDANQAWDYDDALAFAEGVGGCRIDYLEEPLADPRRLLDFAENSGMPFALDESVAPVLGCCFGVLEERLAPEALQRQGWAAHEIGALLERAAAVVVKPTLVGEFGRLVLMARHFANSHCRWVVSAAYESGVGIAALAQLAGALDENDAPGGIDTYRALAGDVLRTPLPLDGPRADLAQVARMARDVDVAALEVVYGE